MTILGKIRETLMLWKLYISRSVTYLSIINSGMILFLFLSRLKEKGVISWSLENYIILIVFVGLLILLLVGWIEINFMKGFEKENEIGFTFTPQYVDMKEKIDKIYELHDKHNKHETEKAEIFKIIQERIDSRMKEKPLRECEYDIKYGIIAELEKLKEEIRKESG